MGSDIVGLQADRGTKSLASYLGSLELGNSVVWATRRPQGEARGLHCDTVTGQQQPSWPAAWQAS